MCIRDRSTNHAVGFENFQESLLRTTPSVPICGSIGSSCKVWLHLAQSREPNHKQVLHQVSTSPISSSGLLTRRESSIASSRAWTAWKSSGSECPSNGHNFWKYQTIRNPNWYCATMECRRQQNLFMYFLTALLWTRYLGENVYWQIKRKVPVKMTQFRVKMTQFMLE